MRVIDKPFLGENRLMVAFIDGEGWEGRGIHYRER